MSDSKLASSSSVLARIARWVRPEVRALSAYHVPPSADFIKLDAMENPYQWPEAMVEEWLAVLRDVSLNRYPDPSPDGLKASLAEAMGVPAGQDVILGNGSDELIQMIALTLAQPGRVVLAPDPSFLMYKIIATFTGMDYVGVPLAEDFSLDLDAMLTAIGQHQPAVVFLAYPNNPTGDLFDRDAVRAVIEASPGLVVVDEAYHAFAGDSFMGELGSGSGKYDNLVVMRTVSKMGLAGLRLGLLAGPSEWLTEFDKTRLPYNINVLTQVSAEFALTHREVLDTQTRQICADRDTLMAELQALDGVDPFPSRANFILFRVERASEVFESLKAQAVLIKNMGAETGPLTQCLRVTVGAEEENTAFLRALESSV
jgi:histidinol-phosphate aminotransferase